MLAWMDFENLGSEMYIKEFYENDLRLSFC